MYVDGNDIGEGEKLIILEGEGRRCFGVGVGLGWGRFVVWVFFWVFGFGIVFLS